MAKIKITEGSPLEVVLERDNGERIILHRGEVGFELTDFKVEVIGAREVVIHIGRG
ncbi:MAG: hypothetical protein GTO22_21010 [Gemmatimonadales bacterium]|nr:hypothetical protein [Gemmatimonadales bacterium]